MKLSATGFSLSETAAAGILTTEPNEFKVVGHAYLDIDRYPKITDFKEFYVYSGEARSALLARALSAQQSIVWGSGTHTHSPVLVSAIGPAYWTDQLQGLMHHTEIGRLMHNSIGH